MILAFQNIENIAAKKSVQDTSNVVKGQMHCIVGGEDIFHERDIKRQKKLNCGLSEMSLESHGQILQRCPSSEIVANSNCNLEYKICEYPVVQPNAVIDQHPPKGSVCAFCHSPKTIEVSLSVLYMKRETSSYQLRLLCCFYIFLSTLFHCCHLESYPLILWSASYVYLHTCLSGHILLYLPDS